MYSCDGKTHNQIDHVLMDKRKNSEIVDVRFFRGYECDTKYYHQVVSKLERLSVSKQAAQKLPVERFSLNKLNDVEVKEQ
jgi:hypothetical protein